MKINKELEGKIRQETDDYLWPISRKRGCYIVTITKGELINFTIKILEKYGNQSEKSD